MSDTTNPLTHVFDQTNGVIDGLEGESDGTAAGDLESAADRDPDGLVAGDDRTQSVAGPGEGSSHPIRDSGSGTARAAGTDSTTATATATDGAQAPADPEEAGVEHTFAVDRAGAATDEGPVADDVDPGAAAVQTEEMTAVDDGPATTASGTDAAPAGEDSTVVEHYDSGPASQVGGTERAADVAPATAVAAGGPDDTDGTADADGTDDAPAAGRTNGLAALIADDSVGHLFDQTNGVVDGLEGESDGTAEGDEDSVGDRRGLNEPNPVGQQDAFHDDHYGAEDGRDPNP